MGSLQKCQVHLILIGDELLSGRINDVNGPWLGQYLSSQYQDLKSIRVVPDSISAIGLALERIWRQSSGQHIKTMVILSGGLGPTRDDLTKKAIASFFDCPLIENPSLAKELKTRYESLGKEWDPQINHYHYFPQGFDPIPNLNGLAPGIFHKEDNKHLLCAPGVPIEFQAMIENFFSEHSEILHEKQEEISKTISVRTRYIPEEEIFGKLCPDLWDELQKWGKVSSLPQPLGVDILIKIDVKNKRELTKIENQIKQYLKASPLAPYIWHTGDESLAEKIIAEAKEKKIQIGFAESCTGGLAASYLTDVSGSSEVFLGSIVSYANQVKQQVLGVQDKTLQKHGAVSTEVALEMAQGARNCLKADITMSFSGIAGPSGGSKKKPVGTVAIGISSESDSQASIFNFKGSRTRLKRRFTIQGLHLLLDAIREF